MSGFIGDGNPSSLGGGMPGAQPRLLGGGSGVNGGTGMVGSGERGRDRFRLRKAFGNNRIISGVNAPITDATAIITPFRAAMNAGDIQGTYNEAPVLPAPNQVNNIRLSANIAASTSANGVKAGSARYSGNPTYVYDSSDYIRFKKLQAKNRNYNDRSFGGSNNGSFVPLMRVRH